MLVDQRLSNFCLIGARMPLKKLCIVLFCYVFMLRAVDSFAVGNYSLDDLLAHAIENYPTILAKQSVKSAAQSDLTAAKLKFLPTPAINTQRNQVAYSGASLNRLPATSLLISQPVWMGGALVAGFNKMSARLSAADFAVLEAQEDVSKRVINAYTDWFRAWKKIQAFEENVFLHEKFAGIIQRRFDQGVASGVDRDLGVSRLLQAKSDLDTQKSNEATALSSLSVLVGENIRREQLLQNLTTYCRVPSRKDALFRLTNSWVAIQRLKQEADAADAEAKEVRAQALPQVSFQAQRQVGNAIVPGSQGYDLYGLVVNFAPGAGFSTVANTSAANDRAKAALIQVETAKLDINDRINSEYNEFEYALVKRNNLDKSAKISSIISSSYDRQYLVGKRNWLDLMNAVRELAQTRSQLADAEATLLGATQRIMVYLKYSEGFNSDSN